jgi:hypothetical protein
VTAKGALMRFRAPDEQAAEDRAWVVVQSAYQARPPFERRRSYRRRAVALAAGIALLCGVALSPAGATVSRLITRAFGVERSSPALVSLPAAGHVLVSGPAGTWTVASDGSIRRIGRWSEASWSPHGLYLAVVQSDELAAVNPRGTVEWALHRPQITDPRWYEPTGYRVAYLSGSDLRVISGDGSGDHLLAGPVASVAPAWRPGSVPYQLAYVSSTGAIVVRYCGTGPIVVRYCGTDQTVWTTKPGMIVKALAWSADGQRLLAVSSTAVEIYNGEGQLLSRHAAPAGAPIVHAALSPNGRTEALVLGGASGGVVTENAAARHPVLRRELAGTGLGQVAWSPDGRWLLVSWPPANQWVFIRVAGKPRISAVSRITQQFSPNTSSGFPQLEGWCCRAHGSAG